MNISKELAKILDSNENKGTKPYDTKATVKRVENGVAWVHIPGGVDETPAQLTINAKPGDSVQVRVADGKAFLVGNGSAPPTDDTTARQAIDFSKIASDAANAAVRDASTARTAAASAQAAADHAEEVAEGVEAIAESAKTAADTAFTNLSQVQSVLEVAQWIATHGTYVKATLFNPNATYYTITATQVTEPSDDDKDSQGVLIYYELDNGIYVRTTDTSVDDQKTYYRVTGTPVAQPSAEHIADYYTLAVSEAMADYVQSHLALTDEGLYIMKDGSEWKVLIGDDGVYILDPNNDPANQMTGDGNIIGYNGESRVEIDYHSLQLIDKDNNAYVHFSDLRDNAGYYESVETFIATSGQTNFETAYYINSPTGYTPTVTVNDVVATVNIRSKSFVLDTPATADDVVQIVYKTADPYIKAYTIGMRRSGSIIGAMSCAEGIGTVASGEESHAEGFNTTASGHSSHAEGYSTEASGSNSHAEGYGTEATGIDSHAEGVNTTASGTASHAEGNGNTASGNASHAEGIITTASGTASHAEGNGSTASGVHSHAQNYGTVANRKSQTVLGEFNIADNQGANESVRGRYAVIVGNGTSVNARSNAFTVDWDGNVEADGDLTDGSGNVLSDMISKSSILDFCHPVGKTIQTVDPNYDPNVELGGTWNLLPEGTIILAGSESGTYKVGADTSTASGYKEYGANDRRIEDANIAHGHGFTQPTISVKYSTDNTIGGTARRYVQSGTSSSTTIATASGGSVHDLGTPSQRQNFNVMQKSIAMYIWIRTA